MEFGYFETKLMNATIDIEDIGNCALKASNDKYEFYYLIISTKAGYSTIIEFGPYNEVEIEQCNATFSKNSFNRDKIIKRIKMFLNNPKRVITQVISLTIEEALQEYIPITELLKGDDR